MDIDKHATLRNNFLKFPSISGKQMKNKSWTLKKVLNLDLEVLATWQKFVMGGVYALCDSLSKKSPKNSPL